jgi:YD repeat-containing protein
VTTYQYELGGRRTVVTRPGGATEISEAHLDGQSISTTGTAVVAQHFEHDVNPDGSRWTQMRAATPDSPMWQRTTVDILGRTIRVEQPGFGGTLEASETFYNDVGQAVRTTSPALADSLYEYDDVGQQLRSGLDLDESGQLEPASNDRISESEQYFLKLVDDWWQQTEQRIYPETDSDAVVVTGRQRTRISGLGGGLTAEQVTEDIHGNLTTSTTYIARASQTETRITDLPDSNIDASSVTFRGRLRSTTSQTGITMTYDYDGLGRRTEVTHPRTGTSTTEYDPNTGRVTAVRDAANNPTGFTYDPLTGRKSAEHNALGNASYFGYNDRGQLTRTWGDVPYPVRYEYDDFGRRVEMRTYRDDLGWSDAEWPASAELSGDATTWVYDEPTGLLTTKLDAAGLGPTYAYGPGGRLESRAWARVDENARHPITF